MTAPSPTYKAALAISGERTGVAAKIGEKRLFKVALPETTSNHYVSFWLGGIALVSGQAERQFNPSCSVFFALFFTLFFAFFCFSSAVGKFKCPFLFLILILSVVRLYVRVLLYCCTQILHLAVVLFR